MLILSKIATNTSQELFFDENCLYSVKGKTII